MDEPLLSVKAAAERLGLKEDTFRWHVRTGHVRFLTIGRGKKRPRRLFDVEDLKDFVEARKRYETPFEPAIRARASRQKRSSVGRAETLTLTELLASSPTGRLQDAALDALDRCPRAREGAKHGRKP